MSDIENKLGFLSSRCLHQSRPSGSSGTRSCHGQDYHNGGSESDRDMVDDDDKKSHHSPDIVGSRSYSPLLDLWLATEGQSIETRLNRDPWSSELQETKSLRSLRYKEHSSFKVIHLRT